MIKIRGIEQLVSYTRTGSTVPILTFNIRIECTGESDLPNDFNELSNLLGLNLLEQELNISVHELKEAFPEKFI